MTIIQLFDTIELAKTSGEAPEASEPQPSEEQSRLRDEGRVFCKEGRAKGDDFKLDRDLPKNP